MTRTTLTFTAARSTISPRLFLSVVFCLALAAPLSGGAENNFIDERVVETTLDDTTRKNRDQERETPDFGKDGSREEPVDQEQVEDYRRRLEARLFERYNNMPDHAGNVGKVAVTLSKPLETSLDGTLIRAEFDQLVFDPWGKRIPALEKEYYVVTFGSGGTRQVRTDPSIRVGLDLEKTYSERVPLAADPFSRVREDRAFHPAENPAKSPAKAEVVPQAKMPEWWRPDFPELQ